MKSIKYLILFFVLFVSPIVYAVTESSSCDDIKKEIFVLKKDLKDLEILNIKNGGFDDKINQLKADIKSKNNDYKECRDVTVLEEPEVVIEIDPYKEECDKCEEYKDSSEKLRLDIKYFEDAKGTRTDDGGFDQRIKELREMIEDNRTKYKECKDLFCENTIKEERFEGCVGCVEIHEKLSEIKEDIEMIEQGKKKVNDEYLEEKKIELKELEIKLSECVLDNCYAITKDICEPCDNIKNKYTKIKNDLLNNFYNNEDFKIYLSNIRILKAEFLVCVKKGCDQNEEVSDNDDKEVMQDEEEDGCIDGNIYKDEFIKLNDRFSTTEDKITIMEDMIENFWRYKKSIKNIGGKYCDTKIENIEGVSCPNCSLVLDQINSNTEDRDTKYYQKLVRACYKIVDDMEQNSECVSDDVVVSDPEIDKECPDCRIISKRLQKILDERYKLLDQKEITKANSLLSSIYDNKLQLRKCFNKLDKKNDQGLCRYEPEETEEFIVSNEFSDISVNDSNLDSIIYLKNKGVLRGYQDGTFKPQSSINRAEFTKIIVEAKGDTPDKTIYRNCFPDVKEEWFAPYICYAKDKGWVKGYNDNKFHPEININKAEAIKVLFEVFYEIEDEDYLYTDSFNDVNQDEWYAKYVNFAQENDILEELENNFFPANDMTRAGISEMIYRLMVLIDTEGV